MANDRRLHRGAETLGRVHDYVHMEGAPHGQAIFFLGFQLLQCLLNTPPGLGMHAAALVQHAVHRGLADASLSGELLDGKMFCAFEHGFRLRCF